MLKKLFKLNRCDWFILACVIYYLQGIAYARGSIISIIMLGIILLVSVNCALKITKWTHKPKYFSGLNVLLIMFSIYGFYYIFINPSTVNYPISGKNIRTFDYIKSIYLSLLPIYAFYYFTEKGYLTEERLQKWGIVFLCSVALSYFQSQQEELQRIMERGSTREEVTNNAGYLFLSCLPMMVLYRRKPLLQYTGLAVIMAFIVLGMKRGAIVMGGISAIFFMIQTIKTSKGKTKFIIIFLTGLICAGAIYFFVYQMEHSEFLMFRIQQTMDGNSSGRDDLYSFFLTHFMEKTGIIHYFLGRGANGTLEIHYNFAHNDWLEIAINQGLIGLFIYLFYWFCFYKTWRNARKSEGKTIMGLYLLIYFALTFFSMSYGDMSYVATCMLGFSLGTITMKSTRLSIGHSLRHC